MNNKNISLWLVGVIVVAGLIIGSYFFGSKQVQTKYTINNFDITAFRNSKLHGNGSVVDIGNNWLKLTDAVGKYTMNIPSISFGTGLNYYYPQDDYFTENQPVDLAAYSFVTNNSSTMDISPAFKLIKTSTIHDLSMDKSTKLAIIPNEESAEVFDGPRSIITNSATTDADIIAVAKQVSGMDCNFTAVQKKESAQSGTFDIMFSGSGTSPDCMYFLTADAISKQFIPAQVKFSPTVKRVMVSAPIQGCRWMAADLSCYDQEAFDSFKFN